MNEISYQPGLFDNLDASRTQVDLSQIAGLRYIPDFIDQQAHEQLLCSIDAQPWLADLKRRVQHYGYKYNYTARSIDQSMKLGPLPEWAKALAEDLVRRELMPEMPDQLIVNEYQPGQGIANHVDCVPCFTDTIASLSLGSPCVMNFTSRETKNTIPLLLQPRSLVVMEGPSRYEWTHGIPARKTDEFQGNTIQRRRRVSLTFRKVILNSSAV